MYLIDHPNLLTLYTHFEDDDTLYLVLELTSGKDLMKVLEGGNKLSEKTAIKYTVQIVNGLENLHKSKIIHRDMKPENLMLGEGDTIKIIDFGLSNFEEMG